MTVHEHAVTATKIPMTANDGIGRQRLILVLWVLLAGPQGLATIMTVIGCRDSDEDTDDDNDGIADTSEASGQRLLPDCGGVPTSTVAIQDGSSANPYCIDTLAELQSIDTGFTNGYTTGNSVTRTRAQSLGYHYRLTANIDAWPTNNATSSEHSPTPLKHYLC